MSSVSKKRRRAGGPTRAHDLDPTLLLRHGLTPLAARSLRYTLERIESDARAFFADQPAALPGPVALTRFLMQRIPEVAQQLRDLQQRQADFEAKALQAVTDEDRAELILDACRALGASDRELEEDERALARWFDETAVLDRFATQNGELLQTIVVMFQRLGAVSEAVAAETPWANVSPEAIVRTLIEARLHDLVSTAALTALADALESDRARSSEAAELDADLLQTVIQLAQDDREDVWVQCRALDVLAAAEGRSEEARPEVLLAVLEQRLTRPGANEDDFFVRRHAVERGERLLRTLPQASVLIFFGSRDPSPSVRQRAAEALVTAPKEFALNLWERLASDQEPVVRIAALSTACLMAQRPEMASGLLGRLAARLEGEADPLVVRAGIRALTTSHAALQDSVPELAREWSRWARGLCNRLCSASEHVQVRRDAAAARERLWLLGSDEARAIAELVREDLPAPGSSRRLPTPQVEAYSPEVWGRALAVLSQEDHCLELERTAFGYRLHRGFRWRFRLWRLLFELRHPAPDKRQAYRHTVGRVHYGEVRAPSRVLSELAETKVPGEPLHDADEGGWRPFLPLLDDFISVLNQPLPGRPVRLHSSEGVTEVAPPRGLWQRLKAYVVLNWRFAELASLRNWSERSGTAPQYLQTLGELGYSIEMRPHEADGPRDETVTRHFPALALPAAPEMFDRFTRYALSLYENSLGDLALFVGGISLFFFGRHWWQNRRVRRDRAAVPLAIGGWGTRGKSSVERLKAALLNALGHGVVSKTTGCEAMLLLGPRHAPLREIFLYRPYDKATIWEQANVLRFSAKVRCDTLLWECMGLTPSYVDVLQRQWMRDDLATLTNTYPDHEDIQGPAGIDIPKVMTLFIPERSTLLTSEEQMLPILRHAAEERDTALSAVDWLDAATIPPDVLARFPYDEHPYNVALLLRMAQELGVPRDFALKEMADRVVPDLGVLKTYPRSEVDGRTLRFSNGMSANERHGCLSNWSRLGLDTQVKEPGEWVTTVVNNRADRIPRSKVFAKILVEDIAADLHVLIGGNLTGLQGYIEEALDEWLEGFSLEQEGRTPEEVITAAIERVGVATSAEQAVARALATLTESERSQLDLPDAPDETTLVSALEGLGLDAARAQSVLDFARSQMQDADEAGALIELVVADSDPPGANTLDRCRKALRAWFLRSVVLIEDYYATGDEIVRRIARLTPPGFDNHVVGLQNIKGTGLDFVYRWQAWEQCSRDLELLASTDDRRRTEGVRRLSAFQEYGVLSEVGVREAVSRAREENVDTGGLFAQLDAIAQRAERAAEATLSAGPSDGEAVKRSLWGRLWATLVDAAEGILDAGDAIRRRKTSDAIYEDLAQQRISIARAATELKAITQRQKGGWLRKRLDRLRARSPLRPLARGAADA